MHTEIDLPHRSSSEDHVSPPLALAVWAVPAAMGLIAHAGGVPMALAAMATVAVLGLIAGLLVGDQLGAQAGVSPSRRRVSIRPAR